MTKFKIFIKSLILASFLFSGAVYAADPLTLELNITNTGKSAEDVVGKFIFPDCADLVNIPANFSWEPALRTLLVPIGNFAKNEVKTVSVQATSGSKACLETGQIKGDWYSDKAAFPAGKGLINFLDLSKINFNYLRDGLLGFGGGLFLMVLLIFVAEKAKLVSVYALAIDFESKNPLMGAQITIYKADGDAKAGFAATDKEGRASIKILPGRYYIVCVRNGYQQLKTPFIEAGKGKENSQILELKRTV